MYPEYLDAADPGLVYLALGMFAAIMLIALISWWKERRRSREWRRK